MGENFFIRNYGKRENIAEFFQSQEQILASQSVTGVTTKDITTFVFLLLFLGVGPVGAQDVIFGPVNVLDRNPMIPVPMGQLQSFAMSFRDIRLLMSPTVSAFEKAVLGGKYGCCFTAVTLGQVAHYIPAGLAVKNWLNLCCTASWAGYTTLHLLSPTKEIFKP